MPVSTIAIEHKWRCKAEAVPERNRGLDLKGLLYQYAIVDHLDSMLLRHQGPPSGLPEEQQTKLMVSLQNAYLVSYEHLHVTEALGKALPYLLEPHVLGIKPLPEGGQELAIPEDGGLNDLPVTPQSLLKASMAALFYDLHSLRDLVLLTSKTVMTTIKEELSPEVRAQLRVLLQRHEPHFGVTELLWVMASLRNSTALTQARTTDANVRRAKLLEAKAAGLDMLRLRPDIPAAHYFVSHLLIESLDLVSARMYLEQGLKVADETNSHSHGCLLRFELAYALLNGADGETFRKGDVQKLVTEGDKMEKQLRKWRPPWDMTILHGIQQRVHQLLAAYPRYQASPDNKRLPSLSLRQGDILPAQGADPAVCDNCGGRFPQLWRCKACRSVSYCTTDCQKAHWKEHKWDCRRIQQVTATQSAN